MPCSTVEVDSRAGEGQRESGGGGSEPVTTGDLERAEHLRLVADHVHYPCQSCLPDSEAANPHRKPWVRGFRRLRSVIAVPLLRRLLAASGCGEADAGSAECLQMRRSRRSGGRRTWPCLVDGQAAKQLRPPAQSELRGGGIDVAGHLGRLPRRTQSAHHRDRGAAHDHRRRRRGRGELVRAGVSPAPFPHGSASTRSSKGSSSTPSRRGGSPAHQARSLKCPEESPQRHIWAGRPNWVALAVGGHRSPAGGLQWLHECADR